MKIDYDSAKVAEALAVLWGNSRKPEFIDYLSSVHQYEGSESPEFSCLYIGETESGDVERGPMGGMIKRWWVVDSFGLRVTRVVKLSWKEETDFTPTPEILFYLEGDRIAIYERLGQRLKCWKTGRIDVSERGVRVEILRCFDN